MTIEPTDAAASELSATFSGQVLRPGDMGYEDARKVHNGLVDKRPALIARCRGTADVVDAVNFARKRGLEVAVRGGGHNVAGRATIDGGLMIDLTPMKGVHKTMPMTLRSRPSAAKPTTMPAWVDPVTVQTIT